MYQWTKTENPQIVPHKYGQPIFDNDEEKYNEGRIVFSTNDDGALGKNKNLHLSLKPLTKSNSKWMVDLNVKYKSMNLLEEKI